MGFRRVVTSMNSEGKSVVLKDEQVESVHAGPSVMNLMWRCAESPSVPNDGAIPPDMTFPEPQGIWIFSWTVPPGSAAESAEAGEAVGIDLEDSNAHSTDTVDVNYLLSGTLILKMDGTEVEVHQGDVIVMNGASHEWSNPGETPATMLSTVVGATRTT